MANGDTRARVKRTESRILALLSATYFIVVLDAAVVRVAIPAIDADLGLTDQGIQWVANSYMLTFAGLLLLGGRAADLLGRRRVFIAGLIVFGLASLACGLAWSQGTLVAARAVQGIGAAAMTPAALSILVNTFREGAARNQALAIWAVAGGGIGATAGWIVGGPLTDGLGWEWIFWINVPLVAGLLVLTPVLIDESRSRTTEREYDPLGALTITAALVAFIYALTDAPDAGWASAQTILLFVVSLLLFAAFVLIEKRAKAPLVPLWIFRSRLLVAANVGLALAAAAIYGMTLMLSLYGQEVLGWSALKFGLAGLAVPVTASIGAIAGQALVTKRGPQALAAIAMVVMAVSFLLLAGIPVAGDYVTDLLPALVVFGPALGAAFTAFTIATLMGIGESEAGLAAGLNNTFEMAGGVLGTAIMATVATSTTTELLQDGAGPPVALTEGFQDAFAVGIPIALLGAVVAVLFLRTGRPAPAMMPAAETDA